MEVSQASTDKQELNTLLTQIRTGIAEVGNIRYSDVHAVDKLEAYIKYLNDEIVFKSTTNKRARQDGRDKPYSQQEIENLRSRIYRAEKRINDLKFVWSQAKKIHLNNGTITEIDIEHNLLYLYDRKNIVKSNPEIVKELRAIKIKWSRKNNRFQGYLTVNNLVELKKIIIKYGI